MDLTVYECISAGSLPPPVPDSLRAEGRAMLSAVVEDFGNIPGVRCTTLLGPDGGADLGHSCRRLPSGGEEAVFRDLAATCDYFLVIAPEFDDLLLTRSRWVLEAGGKLLGSNPEAIALTGNKKALAKHLKQSSLPTPEVVDGRVNEGFFPAVLKPRHGAGSQATFLIQNFADFALASAQGKKEFPGDDFLLQRFVPGQAASVAFLLGPTSVIPLLPARQHLSSDGRFRYQGGSFPLPPDQARRATDLGFKAVQAVPGLRGYVGVDLILGEDPDGSQDWLIEINPRLTTSYVGLRQLASSNLAEAWLAMIQGRKPELITWKSEPLHFSPDGFWEKTQHSSLFSAG